MSSLPPNSPVLPQHLTSTKLSVLSPSFSMSLSFSYKATTAHSTSVTLASLLFLTASAILEIIHLESVVVWVFNLSMKLGLECHL